MISTASAASLSQIFQDLDLSPLIYWFARSPDPHHRELSGVCTKDLFFQLVASLTAILPENWTCETRYSNKVEFRAGPQSQFLVTVSTHGCALVIKLGCLPKGMPEQPSNLIPQIRCWFENGIEEMLENRFPNLHCTVYVSACKDCIRPNQVEFKCLQRLGNLGLVPKELSHVICKVHTEVPALDPNVFKAWFLLWC